MALKSYPKSLTLGQRHVKISDLLVGDYEVTEKVDGSQFGFGWDEEGKLFCRSKKNKLDLDTNNKMFKAAIEHVKTLDPMPGCTFYGEVLHRPRHNVLTYGRIPRNNVILFNMITPEGESVGVTDERMALAAHAFNLELVPVFEVELNSVEDLEKLLETDSVLGGCKIEGVVIKKYGDFWLGADHRNILGAKFVSPKFKEVMTGKTKIKKKNPWQEYKETYKTEARYQKAFQALSEQELITGTKRDIGPLVRYVRQDITEECIEEIKNQLWVYFGEELLKHASANVATWYAQKLMEETFENAV